MASVTINAVDAFVPRIVAAFTFYYPTEMSGVAPGVGIKAVLTEFITKIVSDYEASQAGGTTEQIQTRVAAYLQAEQQKYDNQHAQSVTDCGANLS